MPTAMQRPTRGVLAVVVAGVVWSVLLVWLYAAGHAPSFVAIPLPRESYYLVQAIVTVPWLLLMWWVGARVAGAIAGASANRPALMNAWGVAMSGPLVVLHLLPELVTFAVGGFEALRQLARFSMPLATLGSIVLGVRAVRSTSDASVGRAIGAALLGFVVQSLLAGPVLR